MHAKPLQLKIVLCLLLFSGIASSCKKEENDPFTQNVSSLINSLTYDPNKLLNVQDIGNEPDKRVETGSENGSSSQSGGYITTCGKKKYTLQSNKEEIAILRKSHGTLWPGALIKGNTTLMDGDPDTIRIARNALTLQIDLPNMGANGKLTVESPSDTAVQSAIATALNWWNANAYQEGYVASTSYKTASAYSADQVSMDLGMNKAWADNTIAALFNSVSSSGKKVAMMVVKQAFYTVSMPQPGTSSAVFGQDDNITTVEESVTKIRSVISNEAPPAYIQTVTYGRISLFRMETALNVSPADVEVALQYATGVTNVTGDTETRVKSILANAGITMSIIGKNATVTSQAVSARTYGELTKYINDKSNLYTKQNSGIPILYAVRFLKDNHVARLGYATQYTIEECVRTLVPEAPVSLANNTGPGINIGWDVRYILNFTDKDNAAKTLESGTIEKSNNKAITLPAGSHNIMLNVEYKDGNKWKSLHTKSWSIPTKGCFEAYGSWELFGVKVPQFREVTCP